MVGLKPVSDELCQLSGVMKTYTGLKPVSDELCQLSGVMETYARTCIVPCPMPCLVSEWSTWSECLPDGCRQERSKSKDGKFLRISFDFEI